MSVRKIKSEEVVGKEAGMLFLDRALHYPHDSDDLFSEERAVALRENREGYTAYLQPVRRRIKSRLYQLYQGNAPYLTKLDDRLHDFHLLRLTYERIAADKPFVRLQMEVEIWDGHHFILNFNELLYYRVRYEDYAPRNVLAGDDILLCEIGVIDDLRGSNFLNLFTAEGLMLSVGFCKFDYTVQE